MSIFLRQYRHCDEAASGKRQAVCAAADVNITGLLASRFSLLARLVTVSFAIACLFIVVKVNAASGIYRPINYQGRITNSGGTVVPNGTYNMRFKIFNAASGGSPLWSETWNSGTRQVTLTGGLFSIALGSQTSMTGSVDFSTDSLYLQVEFDPANDNTYPEVFAPRRRFGSVPYAHNADKLDGVDASQLLRSDTNATASGTLTIKPNDAAKIGMDIVSTAGIAGVAGLRISTQGANHIIFGSGALNYDTNLYRSAVATLRTDGSFQVTGTVSGSVIHAENMLTSSGSIVTEGSLSGSTLAGFGLGSCNGSSQKLLFNNSTGKFECSVDQTGGSGTFGSGNVLTLGDARYVNQSGDTMTGALTITITNGTINTVGLKIVNALSGAVIHAETSLTTSGSLVFEGSGSGSALWVSSFSGAGLTNCDPTSGKLTWSNGRFVCGTDQSTGSGLDQASGDARYVKKQGDTMTGALTINLSSGYLGLKVLQMMSGSIIHAEKSLTSSGTILSVGNITTRGTLSGSIATLNGAGNNYFMGNVGIGTISPSNKLTVAGPTGTDIIKISAGTEAISDAGYLSVNDRALFGYNGSTVLLSDHGATKNIAFQSGGFDVLRLTTDRKVGINNTNPSTALHVTGPSWPEIRVSSTSVSEGSTLSLLNNNNYGIALQVLGSSRAQTSYFGLTDANGAVISSYNGNEAWLALGTIGGNAPLIFGTNNTERIRILSAGNVGIGKAAPNAKLDVAGLMSGAHLSITGNANITGALLVKGNITNRSTYSGNILHVEKTLTSSGTLVFEGSASGRTLSVMSGVSVLGRMGIGTPVSNSVLALNSVAGNADVTFANAGTTKFALGIDAADSNKFKIASSSSVGTFPILTILNSGVSIAYTNTGGSGNRTGVVTGSDAGSMYAIGSTSTLLDGANAVGTSFSSFAVSGKWLQFDFGAASSKVITEAKWYQSGAQTHGTWQWQGSSNASTWFDIGSSFTLGGANTQTITTMASNVTGYRYYRMLGVSGNSSTGPWLYEIEFKIGDAPTNSYLGINNASPGAALDVKGWGSTASTYTFRTQNAIGTTNFIILDSGAVGIGTSAPETALEVVGTVSGGVLHAQNTMSSSGAVIVVGNITTRGTLSGNSLTISRNASISGALLIAGSTTVRGTYSGNILHAEKSVTSSGALVFEGSASGASLWVSAFNGAGLTNCDPTTGKLIWNNNKFSCGTDQGGAGSGMSYSAAEGMFVNQRGDTMTGALVINPTLLGTASGAFVINQTFNWTGAYLRSRSHTSPILALDASLDNAAAAPHLLFGYNGTFDTNLYRSAAATLRTDGSFIAQKALSGGLLIISRNATISGSLITVGNITTRGTLSGNSLTISRNASISGALLVKGSITDRGTYSGNMLHVEKWLTSSGLIMVTQRAVQGSGALVVNQTANSTGAYITSTATNAPILVLNANVNNAARTPHLLFGYQGTFDASIFRSKAATLTMSGNLIVTKTLSVGLFGAATATTICKTSTGMLANCSSSIRYKEDVQDLSLGLATIQKMRPVTFKWKGRDEHDLGFIAEEVSQVDPSLVTYDNGQIQGVKYMQLTAVLTNAVKELDLRTLGITNASGTVLHARDLLSSSGGLMVSDFGMFGSGILLSTRYKDGNANVLEIKTAVRGTGSTVFRVNASGSVFTAGTFNAHGADYAEWFREGGQESGISNQGLLMPGEAVCLDTTEENAVRRCDRDGDNNIIGIVSTDPAFIGNVVDGTKMTPDGRMPKYVLVGLIGQVPAKAIVEGSGSTDLTIAQIHPGDNLTAAAKAGFVRKARAGESTVGVALEGLDSGEGVIRVLISRRNQSLTVEAVEENVTRSIAAMNIQDQIQSSMKASLASFDLAPTVRNELDAQITSLNLAAVVDAAITKRLSGAVLGSPQITDAFVQELGARLKIGTGSVAPDPALTKAIAGLRADIDAIARTLTGSDLKFVAATISDLTVKKSLTISGALILSTGSTLHIGSDFQIGALHLAGSGVTIGSLTASGALGVIGPITISGLATFLGDVRIQGQLILSSRQAGFAVIPETGSAVTVRFDTPMTATPIVTATPDVPTLFGVSKVTATGFIIRIAAPATEQITFSFIALAADTPRTTMGTGTYLLAGGLIPFPVNAKHQPFSVTDPVWTACVQGRQTLDSLGIPLSCSRYHDGAVWEHPDLKVFFTWNPNHDPPIFTLPEGYQVVVVDDGIDPPMAIQDDATHAAAPVTGSGSTGTGSGTIVTPATGSGEVVNPPVGSGSVVPPATGSGDTVAPATGSGEAVTPPAVTPVVAPAENQGAALPPPVLTEPAPAPVAPADPAPAPVETGSETTGG